MNKDRTCNPADAELTQARSPDVLAGFKAMRRELSRRRPHLPEEASNHASDLIEQIDSIHDEADLARLKPFMLRSVLRLEAARRDQGVR